MACPVQKAIREIRGGWDNWEDDEGSITIGDKTYVCRESVFLYTIYTMEFARMQLGKFDERYGAFFAEFLGKSRAELARYFSLRCLKRVEMLYDYSINSLERSIDSALREIMYKAFREKQPLPMPPPSIDYSQDIIGIANQYVEYAKSFSAEISPLPPISLAETAAEIIVEALPKDIEEAKKQFIGIQDVIRGVGRREAEYLSAISKLQQVERALLNYK